MAYATQPKNVVASRKLTDLCEQCEAQRSIRLALISHASSYGFSVNDPGPLAGQKQCMGPGDTAAQYLSQRQCVKEKVVDLLEQYNVLLWHEELVRTVKGSYDGLRENNVVLNFDFGSKVPLKSERGGG